MNLGYLRDPLMKLKVIFPFLLFPLFSNAAIVTPFINEGGGVNIAITGAIDNGDGMLLGNIVKEIRDMALPIDYVALDIPGGELDDAVQMSYIIRSIRAKTYVSEGSNCRNECLIVFSAGDKRILSSRAKISTKGLDFVQGLADEDEKLFDPEKLMAFYDVPPEIAKYILAPPSRKVYRFKNKDRSYFESDREFDTSNINVFSPFFDEKKDQTGYELYLNGLSYYAGIGVGKDYQIAMYYFKKAADKGIAEAFHRIGVLYFKGLGQAQPDKNLAENYWQRSAEVGYYPSVMNLAVAFENSDATETAEVNKKILSDTNTNDLTRAFAAFSLGNYYLYDAGRKSAGSQVNAMTYYRNGAYLGNSDAQWEYASMLIRNGKRQEAYYWLKLACSVEQEDSCRYLKRDIK